MLAVQWLLLRWCVVGTKDDDADDDEWRCGVKASIAVWSVLPRVNNSLLGVVE